MGPPWAPPLLLRPPCTHVLGVRLSRPKSVGLATDETFVAAAAIYVGFTRIQNKNVTVFGLQVTGLPESRRLPTLKSE